MNFRSVAQLSDQVLDWTRKLPHYDVVVGIPRSGLLVATLIATYRNVPLAELDGFLEGRCIGAGASKRHATGLPLGDDDPLSRPCRVLVVDDSLWTGNAVQRARDLVEAAGLPHDVEYGAVYVLPGQEGAVDHYVEALRPPRVFEWNVLHIGTLGTSCLDMDGVLCHDPSGEDNDDGDRYLDFIANARPLHVPTAEIGWVVTSRLEKYREPTARWLDAQGIRYRELVMLDLPDIASRRRPGIRTAFKADTYRQTGAELFVESSVYQSFEIANLANKPVLCIDTMQLIQPGTMPMNRPVMRTTDPTAPSSVGKLARRVLPDPVKQGLVRLRNSLT